MEPRRIAALLKHPPKQPTMLDLLCSKEKSSLFPQFEQRLGQKMRRYVQPFTTDAMLAKYQDADDLYMIALAKLDDAIRDYVYDPSLEAVHNERRFLAMLKKYITNALIDQQYGANVDKRKPKDGGVINASQISEKVSEDTQSESAWDFTDESASTPEQDAEVREIVTLISQDLRPDEQRVLNMLVQGYPAEKIASRLGENVSRVRYIIYEKIQPSASRYVND